MRLLIEIPDEDIGWVIEVATDGGEFVLHYRYDDAPPDIKVITVFAKTEKSDDKS